MKKKRKKQIQYMSIVDWATIKTHLIDIDRLTLTCIYGFFVRKFMISKINVSTYKHFGIDNSYEFLFMFWFIRIVFLCFKENGVSIEYKIISILSNFITFNAFYGIELTQQIQTNRIHWIYWILNMILSCDCECEWIIIGIFGA